jgi:hypothetical protein
VIQPVDWDSFISLSAALENSELGSLVFESMGRNIILDNVSGRVYLKFDANWESKPKLNFLLGILLVVRWIFDFSRFRHSVPNFESPLADCSE